jgi:endonuclease I
MKINMKKILFLLIFTLPSLIFAIEPYGYYNTADGTTSNQLRLALQGVIDNHTVVDYDGLWLMYYDSDRRSNGKIWDIYSTCTFDYGRKSSGGDQCGSYTNVCDCYNREHSVPKSWFSEARPMYSDGFHLYPTDGKVNGLRSNFPYGETNAQALSSSYGSNALGKLGNSSFAGFSGTVFEPDDQYKGDLARTYFYMATRYANLCSGWGNSVFGSNNNGLTDYAKNLFLKWHRQDPVSQKEIDRNDAIFGYQHNRNPFIDHPELAEYIWGNQVGTAWHYITNSIDLADVTQLEIYPIPAIDFIIVKSEETVQSFDYEIFTISSQIIGKNTANFNEQINISNLSDGIYFMKITINGKTRVNKLIINK